VDINAAVLDLGITGQSPPNNIGVASGSINDSILFADTAIEVSFTATTDGGAKYIDDFQFEGIKSADSCISIPTGIPEKPVNDFSAFVSGNKLTVRSSGFGDKSEITIYNITGEIFFSQKLIAKSQQQNIDVSNWVDGIYFVRLKTLQSTSVRKIAILH
jgi:hypothetical protein